MSRQVALFEAGQVEHGVSDGEPVHERSVEEMHDEPAIFEHAVAVVGADSVMGITGVADGVEVQATRA